MGKIDVGASSAHRWTVCTASPQFILDHEADLPSDRTSYADEGTLAHAVAANILLNEPIPTGLSDELVGYVNGYVAHVQSHGGKLAVETKLPLFYMPDRNGIIDAASSTPDAIYIDDLKYGVGVSVDAQDNEQLAIYGESIIRQWEQAITFKPDHPIHLTIYQPRDRNNPEPVRTWVLTRRELAELAGWIEGKAAEVMSGNGVFKVSDKGCRFCKAKGMCSAYANQGLVALPEAARIIELPEASTLSRSERVKVLAAKKVLIGWLEAVEDQEVSELMAGADPQGFKLVTGKSNRAWSDIDAAQKLLSLHLTLDITRPRADLISPHKAQEALKNKELSERFQTRLRSLITKPEGKPTLVAETDPRPALLLATTFDNIDVI